MVCNESRYQTSLSAIHVVMQAVDALQFLPVTVTRQAVTGTEILEAEVVLVTVNAHKKTHLCCTLIHTIRKCKDSFIMYYWTYYTIIYGKCVIVICVCLYVESYICNRECDFPVIYIISVKPFQGKCTDCWTW